jgi:hypothetical protein
MTFKCAEQFVKEMKNNPDLREKISKVKNCKSLKEALNLNGFDFNQNDLTKAMVTCMEEAANSGCGVDQKSTGACEQTSAGGCGHESAASGLKLDKTTQTLIAVGAATAANCIPCFEHIYCQAGSMKISDEQIQAAVDIGSKVKTGASLAIKGAIKEFMSNEAEAGEQECCTEAASCC